MEIESGEAFSGVFDLIGDEYETIAFGNDPHTGLRAIVAIHSTALGPALGGTRFRPYPSEAEALVDVCRLARGMTYKHAAAGLNKGGGKAVILGEPGRDRTDELVLAYGRFVDGLAGRYITAEDVGTTKADMDLVASVTDHVTGVSMAKGGSGDPSPATAFGVFWAMRAAARAAWGDPDLGGRHVVVSGVGKVGAALVGHLAEAGCRITVSDVRAEAVTAMVDRFGVDVVAVDDAHRTPADIFSPCALGAVLSAETIGQLGARVVVGSANNQLATPDDGPRLAQTGVLYVPDYIANAGGVINIAHEHEPGGYDRERAWAHVAEIEATVTAVLERARSEQIDPATAADRHAEDRLAAARPASVG